MHRAFLLLFLPAVTLAGANVRPEISHPLPSLVLDRGGSAQAVDLANHIADPDVPGTAMRIRVRLGAQHKNIDFALFDTETPQTVANFLAYIEAGRFNDNFFHRSVPGFIIQGGGFRFVGESTFDSVPTFPPVPNEPGISNLRGTIAMAKIGGDPDSATSGWFINLADNSANLDAQNGGFTVFGRVVGQGMAVADEIAALPDYNATALHPAWTDLPLKDYNGQLARNQFVETTAFTIPALIFTAQPTDPTLVSASVEGSILTLTPAPAKSGTTTVTVSASDLDGESRSFLLNIQILDTYTSWKNDWSFSSEAAADPTADPDGDSWANLLEFAFNGSPLLPATPVFAPRIDPTGEITFGHRKNSRLQYTAWMSTDLATWSPVWTTADGLDHPAITTRLSQDAFDLLTLRPEASLQDAPTRFWRVTISPTD